MKCTSFVLLVLLTLSACNTPIRNSDQPISEEATPETLDDEYSDIRLSSYSKRSGNLVDRLFNEAKEKNQSLDDLSEKVERLKSNERENLEEYREFISNNDDYWRSARIYIEQINDSTLRKKIDLIVEDLKADYKKSIAQHDSAVVKLNESKQLTDDYYSMIKLMVTLPMIANYQKNELPDINVIKDEKLKYDSLTESLKAYPVIEK
ncbi:MAG: hypothetical protein AAFQ94_07915 [Bacteroidota bacterium]